MYSFIVKTETSMSLGSENFARYEINYTSSSIDLMPPSILEINALPCFTSNGYSIEVRLVDDRELKNVSLYYSLDDDIMVSAPIKNLGNGVYSTNFTLTSTTQQVSLAIEARDSSDNAIWFSTKPIARRGNVTEINANINEDKIYGKLTIIEGVLLQPVYLKVKTEDNTMYTLTDIHGNFEFLVPYSMLFPVEIELVTMGPYWGSSSMISKPEIYDIAITQVMPSKTVTSNNVQIYVLITNQGNFAETFNLTICYNASFIALTTVTLPEGSIANITFQWNTTTIAKGHYSITAIAQPVLGENDTTDNMFTYKWIVVTIPGDVDGDFDVDIYDMVLISGAYVSQLGEPQYNANCDIDDDGDVDIYDVVIAAENYGEKYNP